MVPRHTDVVVVGGGPAGAAAAVTCATAGLDVTLIETTERGRIRKPGETLHPGVDPVLRELGAAHALDASGSLRHDGQWVQWGGPARFEAFGEDEDGPWRGYQVLRETFDEVLLDRAREAGAMVLRPCKAIAAVVKDGRVHGVRTTSGTLAARTVLDASGRRHWLARQLGVPVVRHSPRLVAAYGYRYGSWGRCDAAPLLRADGQGWTWIAPLRPGMYAWVHLVLDPRSTRAEVPSELSGLACHERPSRGVDVTWRMAAPSGPGYLLTGDACAVLDPTASHGILRALMSGMFAARAAIAELSGRTPAGWAAAQYRRWMTDWFAHDVARLDALYHVFPTWREGKSALSQSAVGPGMLANR